MLISKSFNLGVFFEVLGRLVLDIVVEGEDQLTRIVDLASSNLLESIVYSVRKVRRSNEYRKSA